MSIAQDDVIARAALGARRGTAGWWRATCPLCPAINGKSGGDTLAVRASGVWMCFRCGLSGRVFDIEGLGEEPGDEPEAADAEPEMALPEGFLPLSGFGGSAILTRPARSYLEGRGLDRAVWAAAELGATVGGYFGGRIVAPVRGTDGGLLGWVARDYTGRAERKYLYPRGMPRGSILYQEAILEEETDAPALVVEGVFDALPYVGEVVACFGKPTRGHVEILARARRPIAVCLDGDAWREAEALSMRLRLRGHRAGFVRLPPRTDPHDLAKKHGPEALLEAARRAIRDGEARWTTEN